MSNENFGGETDFPEISEGRWRLPTGPSPLVRSGPGALAVLGELAREFGFQRTLVCSDPGIAAAGITGRALDSLRAAGITAACFSDFAENPKESEVARGAEAARRLGADSLAGVGGGSSLDVAKGVGFLLAGGGRMEDYRGYDRCPAPLPPLLGVPTTAGTGSEAQSYALISRDRDHRKCACGAPSAMFRGVVLDPELLPSAPLPVIAAAGFDAVAHAVETAVSSKRTEESLPLSQRAFRLLRRAFPEILGGQPGASAWEAMQRGAFLAGAAIERSMLGAAHALANPLTRLHGLAHGRALAITLPPVTRWNGEADRSGKRGRGRVGEGYRALLRAADLCPPGSGDPAKGSGKTPAEMPEGRPEETLAELLGEWVRAAGLPESLAAAGIPAPETPAPDWSALAREAAEEWTGRCNPRPFDAAAALALYRSCA